MRITGGSSLRVSSVSTTLVSAVEQPQSASTRRRVPHLGLGALALVVVALVVFGAIQHLADSRARQPLRMIEAAADASGNPVGIISPARAEHWQSGGGPRESLVQSFVEPGNPYLEPLFYAINRESFVPGGDERCYLLAVQRGRAFQAEAVTSLMRICYLDPYKSPQSVFGSSELYRD